MLSSMASARDQFACDNYFGENLQIVGEKIFEDIKTKIDFGEGDFNGDGLKDKVLMLRLNKTTQFHDGVTLLRSSVTELNGGELKQSTGQVDVGKVASLTQDTIALGIIQSNVSDKKCRKLVIYNTDYFSPLMQKYLAINIVHAANPEYPYPDLQNYVSGNLRYDAIYLNGSNLNGTNRVALVYLSNGKYMFEIVIPEEFPSYEG